MITKMYDIVLMERDKKLNIIETHGDTATVIRYLKSNRYDVICIRLQKDCE